MKIFKKRCFSLKVNQKFPVDTVAGLYKVAM